MRVRALFDGFVYLAGFLDVSHGGLVSGYRSRVHLFPDKALGIYLTSNGPNTIDSRYAMRAIMYYIADVHLGLTPWLNASGACKFPEPWSKARVRKASKVTYPTFPAGSAWGRPIADFVGIYGHLAFENITIYVNKSTGVLNLRHGRLGHGLLYPTDRPLTFNLIFIGTLAYIAQGDGEAHVYSIEFLDANGRIESLIGGHIEKNSPQKFVRNLDFYDLPPKQTDEPCVSSGDSSTTTNVFSLIFAVVLILSCKI